jgi:DegV family protein with EDD domain
MSERYAIVVDGTAVLPAEIAHELDIRVVPQHVIFGTESFTEGVDITPAEFYERLPRSRATTSAPSMGEFRAFYDAAISEGARGILVLVLATELSSTYSIAASTAQQIGDARIEVIDCRALAGSIGLVATACARARRDGASFDEALALAHRLAGRVPLLAIIDTLAYLRRSGRATSMQAIFGSLLSVKPILDIHDGKLDPIEKVRTRERAMERLKQLIEQRSEPGARVHFSALHTNAADRARLLVEWAQERFHCVESYTCEAGPAIAAHGGPGVVGACWYAESLLRGAP